jgi:hypothetical protein
MRLVVTGGRDYSDTARIFEALDDLHAVQPITTLIHGDAAGVDRRCGAWAYQRGVPVDKYPAPWDDIDHPQAVVRYRRDGKPYDVMAGPRRNQQMIDDGKPDAGMVFPGGTGTADMRSRMVVAELEIFEVE